MAESISPAPQPDNENGVAVVLDAQLPATLAGQRLDRALAVVFPDFSRARLQRWIREGAVRVDGRDRRPRDLVAGGENVRLRAVLESEGDWPAQAMPLDVIWQDEHVLVIDKPPGLVVHPGAGNRDGTLLNALLHLDPALASVPRAGIVHRLDKHTSGLLMIARTLPAHTRLVQALKRREVSRQYLALVYGALPAGGSVRAAIGRHATARVRMTVRADGRPAVTHYRVGERFDHHTLLEVRLETGRTHQIRVHMSHAGHALVGDPLYAGRSRVPPGAGPELRAALAAFGRQALHAWRLGFEHPVSRQPVEVTRPPPADMRALLDILREHDR